MKIFFYSIAIVVFAVVVSLLAGRNGFTKTSVNPIDTENAGAYQNQIYHYAIDVPSGYKIDEAAPELVLFESGLLTVRVNYGCYDFGLEDLLEFSEPVEIGGRPGLKQSFYMNDQLVFKRMVLDVDGQCIYIEYWATEQHGWQDAEELIKSFRITE
jgi:hypothetical protein